MSVSFLWNKENKQDFLLVIKNLNFFLFLRSIVLVPVFKSRRYAPQDICPPQLLNLLMDICLQLKMQPGHLTPELIFGVDICPSVLILQMDICPPLFISERDICLFCKWTFVPHCLFQKGTFALRANTKEKKKSIYQFIIIGTKC